MILVCGEALIDLVPLGQGDEPTYVARAGGSSFNVAMGLGRLGVSVGFVGRVSQDPFGRMLRRRLASAGVDCRFVREGAEPSALAIVHLEAGPEPVYTFHGERTADRLLRVEDLPAAFRRRGLRPASRLDLDGSRARRVGLRGLMRREHGRRVLSLDPNVRPTLIGDHSQYLARLEGWISLADVVKVSRADLAWLYPATAPDTAAADWLRRGPGVVVVTRGRDGAVRAGGSRPRRGRRSHGPVSDTVGAGDAFTSGLLAWLQEAGWLDRTRLRSNPG